MYEQKAAMSNTDPITAYELILNADSDGLERELARGLPGDSDAFGRSLLHTACLHGCAATAELLLRWGASVTRTADDGDTVLMAAASSGNTEVVALLLRAGAQPQDVDVEGRCALMYGARSGNLEVVRALLDAGADIDSVDSRGLNAGHWAMLDGDHADVLGVLLGAGLTLFADDKAPRHLDYAIQMGRVACKALLENRAGAND